MGHRYNKHTTITKHVSIQEISLAMIPTQTGIESIQESTKQERIYYWTMKSFHFENCWTSKRQRARVSISQTSVVNRVGWVVYKENASLFFLVSYTMLFLSSLQSVFAPNQTNPLSFFTLIVLLIHFFVVCRRLSKKKCNTFFMCAVIRKWKNMYGKC